MTNRPLVVSVLFACLSHAFLLPPSISTDEINLIESLYTQDFGPTDQWLVEMDYPPTAGSPISMGDMRSDQAKSIVELNFTVQQHKNTDQLLLNQLPIYPITSKSQDIIKPFTVSHRVKNDDKTWKKVSLADFGYLITVIPNPQDVRRQKVEEIAMKIDLFKMNDNLFDKIHTIDMQLLSIPSGKLMIQVPQKEKSKSLNSIKPEPKRKCSSFLCKAEMGVLNVFSKTKGALKPCHKVTQLQDLHNQRNSTPHPHPHHHKTQLLHNHHHMNKNHPSSEFQNHNAQQKKDNFFIKTILPFLSPELVAVLIGATSALAAMLLGFIAINTWAYLRRRKANDYTLIQQSNIEDMENEFPSENYSPGLGSNLQGSNTERISEKMVQ